VSLNGRIQRDPGAPVSGKHDQIAIDGKVIEPQSKIYVMINKPRGVVTTASDEKGRDTVYGLLNFV
jgi:23S rRNA pseudouridine2605 synthase